MELNEPQIQALSSAIEIASRNNMANVIENYVSSDYDITQLGTMNELLVDYLNQSDTGQFLDNIEHLDRLMSAKQEFDLQIAHREELLSDDEINLPNQIPYRSAFGDQSKEWFTESDLLADFVQDNPEMSFALANAVLGYLDENSIQNAILSRLKCRLVQENRFYSYHHD